MEEFSDVAKARESYQAFSKAVSTGREILRRAGVPDPPPVPEFETVFRRLDSGSRTALYEQIRLLDTITPQEALRIWQPLLKRAFGAKPKAEGSRTE